MTALPAGLAESCPPTPDAQAMGDVDEMNSHLGLLLVEDMPAGLREELGTIQHDLFDLGGELCIPGYTLIKVEHVARLDALNFTHYHTLIIMQSSMASC